MEASWRIMSPTTSSPVSLQYAVWPWSDGNGSPTGDIADAFAKCLLHSQLTTARFPGWLAAELSSHPVTI